MQVGTWFDPKVLPVSPQTTVADHRVGSNENPRIIPYLFQTEGNPVHSRGNSAAYSPKFGFPTRGKILSLLYICEVHYCPFLACGKFYDYEPTLKT